MTGWRPFLEFLKLFFRPKCALLLFLWVIMLEQNGGLASLVLKASKMDSGPIFPGTTVVVLVTITHEGSAVDNAHQVSLNLRLPSYVTYGQYTSNGSRAPDDVTITRNNHLSIAMKFNKLLASDHVTLQVTMLVDPENSFKDDSFHYAPCRVSLRYEGNGPCGYVSAVQTKAMTQITFYTPACEGFRALGLQTGDVKDSQITASSSRATEYLPHGARIENSSGGWIPLKYSGGGFLFNCHFVQIDLRKKVQFKMVAIQGVAKAISAENIILLSLSEDGLDWKQENKAFKTEVDSGTGANTVTVMKALRFVAIARLVRVFLPPYDKRLKQGEELPDYKIELFSCGDAPKGKGKIFDPLPVGVGVESGDIPDNQLTSSSEQGPGYGAQYSRLNSQSGEGAWCAGSCDPSVYLQIDLSLVRSLREFEVQSKHGDSGDTNSVLSFYFEYSADGSSWIYYTANGANKLFLGSPLRNLAVRHKLLFPVLARFVRFRPKTCINMACMRVEFYWYPDHDKDVSVIFARSFLLVEATNTVFICNSDVKSTERHCKVSSDGGNTWQDLPKPVLNVLAYDPSDDIYYGISINKKTFLKSGRSPFMAWNGINNVCNTVIASPSVITATEVPFVPVLLGDADKPYEALHQNEMWGASSKGLFFRSSVGSSWNQVFSWIDCPDDMRSVCLGKPCGGNGICREKLDGGYSCACYPGFQGKHCRIDIDLCASSPCSIGATCVEQKHRFSCICPPEFTGALCDVEIDECASNPCVNGACVDGFNSYTCNCNPGYSGIHCETDVDECASSPCAIEATCVDHVNHFTCTCPPGYTGVLCESNLCWPSNPCLNGGTCTITAAGEYNCVCPFFYGGANCQQAFYRCERSSPVSHTTNPPWPNADKFDKITFSVSADQYILGLIVGSNVDLSNIVKLTVKLTDMAGNQIAIKSLGYGPFPGYTTAVWFNQPYRITADQQYIAATQVVGLSYNNIPLISFINMVSYSECGPAAGRLTVTFSTVPQAELDDSNGSTASAGRVPALFFKPL